MIHRAVLVLDYDVHYKDQRRAATNDSAIGNRRAFKSLEQNPTLILTPKPAL
jgi:hypothetical protein